MNRGLEAEAGIVVHLLPSIQKELEQIAEPYNGAQKDFEFADNAINELFPG